MIDLSKATKLREVAFNLDGIYNPWVTMTLKTVTPRHIDLQEITISSSTLSRFVRRLPNIRRYAGHRLRQWMELDTVLVQLWESHPVHVKIAYCSGVDWEQVPELIEELMPETTRRGIVETVDFSELR